jgi:hypothetical protein
MNFEKQKQQLINKVNELKEEYDSFSRTVNPSHWRATGHHYTDLCTMSIEIGEFTEMTDEQKADPKIQEMLN